MGGLYVRTEPSTGRRKKLKKTVCAPQPVPLVQHLLKSQTGLASRPGVASGWRDSLATKLPGILQEKELPVREWQKYDKAFACAWLDDTHVVVGTKCNQLLCVNVHTAQLTEVAIPSRPARPPELQDRMHQSFNSCGIHSIQSSPSGDKLCTGGDDPSDCQIFKLFDIASGNKQPSLIPTQTLVGHQDWVFGTAWLDNEHVVTGSRDKSVRLWQVNQEGKVNASPVLVSTEHQDKVRDVQFCHSSNVLATLSSDAKVKIWDKKMQLVKSVDLPFKRELVCLAVDHSMVGVGSQGHVTLMDVRLDKPIVSRIKSLDGNQGVRSLAFSGQMLSMGSGSGCVAFYDMRAAQFLTMPSAPGGAGKLPAAEPQAPRQYLKAGKGWLCENEVFRDHFQGQSIHSACYAHAWDPSRTKLFACGGPLAFGLKGSYMALWD